MVNPDGAVKVDVQPGSAPPPILGEYVAVPAVACDFHTPGAVTSPVGPPHAAPTGSTTLPWKGDIVADGGGGEPDEEGVMEGVTEPVGEKEGVAEPVREPVELPVIEAVREIVLEGVTPVLQEGVGVPEEESELVKEAVGEGVEEHVGTSAVLPAEQDEGQPHAVHVAIEVAPRAALNVPAPHCEGVTELAGQKEPAGHADVVMVYEMPLAGMLMSL